MQFTIREQSFFGNISSLNYVNNPEIRIVYEKSNRPKDIYIGR